MPADKSLLAKLPDPRRCKHKKPAVELDRVVKRYPWFRFGFIAGDRHVTFSCGPDGTGNGPDPSFFVSQIDVTSRDGGTQGTNGPCGDRPFSKVIGQLDGPAPDLRTLWVSTGPKAPRPLPFADLVAAALIQLLRADAPPPEDDGAIALAQRAFNSDTGLHAFVDMQPKARLIFQSGGIARFQVWVPSIQSKPFLRFDGAVREIAARYGKRFDLAQIQFNPARREREVGPWVDRTRLNQLVIAALAEALERPRSKRQR